MANFYLIEIGMNDELRDVIRKVNQNFRQVTSSLMRDSKNQVYREISSTESAINGAIGTIRSEIENAKQELDIYVANAKKEIDTEITKIEERIKEIEERLDKLEPSDPNPGGDLESSSN